MSIVSDIYTSLPIQRETDIRLLTLYQGSGDDDIRCSLKVTDLYQKPFYEALSYCWGSPNEERLIYLDKQEVRIRENLWWALRHLRLANEERILWIDALCINQKDIEERNH